MAAKRGREKSAFSTSLGSYLLATRSPRRGQGELLMPPPCLQDEHTAWEPLLPSPMGHFGPWQLWLESSCQSKARGGGRWGPLRVLLIHHSCPSLCFTTSLVLFIYEIFFLSFFPLETQGSTQCLQAVSVLSKPHPNPDLLSFSNGPALVYMCSDHVLSHINSGRVTQSD